MIHRQHLLTCDAPGTQRHLQSLHFLPADGAGAPRRKVYIQASLHADEVPAMLVAHHLRQLLLAAEADGRLAAEVVLVPMANPVGLSQRVLHAGQGRFELGSGENFNRHFPGLIEPAVNATEACPLDGDPRPRVRQALVDAVHALPATTELVSLRRCLLGLAVDADIVLDLHCDNEAVLHLYTAHALWPQVEPLAGLLGAELVLLAAHSGGDPFDEACSAPWLAAAERWRQRGGRPLPWPGVAVTVELRGEADVSDTLARRDAEAVLNYLAHLGIVSDGSPTGTPACSGGMPRPLAGSMPVHVPRAGVLVFHREVGEQLAAGDLIADLICPLEGRVTAITSPVDGLLYAREHRRWVTAGARIAKVAGMEPRRQGPLLSA
jgi:uncharacterized protein